MAYKSRRRAAVPIRRIHFMTKSPFSPGVGLGGTRARARACADGPGADEDGVGGAREAKGRRGVCGSEMSRTVRCDTADYREPRTRSSVQPQQIVAGGAADAMGIGAGADQFPWGSE